jgi:hypothetical protein
MTHIRVEDTSIVHRKSSCRRGGHRYGAPLNVGAGILRRVCQACGSVSIDVSGAVPEAVLSDGGGLET